VTITIRVAILSNEPTSRATAPKVKLFRTRREAERPIKQMAPAPRMATRQDQ
jgi:hypothetical protein